VKYVYVVVAVERNTGEEAPDVGLWAHATYAGAGTQVQALNATESFLYPRHYAKVLGRFEFVDGPQRRAKKG
jgi:hypothetical protein